MAVVNIVVDVSSRDVSEERLWGCSIDLPVPDHHGEVVAEYRRHGSNMPRDLALILKSEVTVLRRQRKYVGSKQYKAYKARMRHSREYFGKPVIEQVLARMGERRWQQATRGLLVLLIYHLHGFTVVVRACTGQPKRFAR